MNAVKDLLSYVFNMIKIWVIIQPWESAIRVRIGKHKKKLAPGIHFKLPYFDSVYVQENRLRIASMPVQTVTTKDLKTITIDSAIGYSIDDIEKLYERLYHPEITISNFAMARISKIILNKDLAEIKPKDIEDEVFNELTKLDYGLKFDSLIIKTFAVVRTFRLIQDSAWVHEGLPVSNKK